MTRTDIVEQLEQVEDWIIAGHRTDGLSLLREVIEWLEEEK